MSIKNSNYTIGNRTRYLTTCSAVPQPTVLSLLTGMIRKALHNSLYTKQCRPEMMHWPRESADFSTNLRPYHVRPYAIHLHAENPEMLST